MKKNKTYKLVVPRKYIDMFKNLFNGKNSDAKMVELITDPKWAEDIKKINELKGYEKKLMGTIKLMGKVTAASITKNKQKPMELELNKSSKDYK